MKPSYDTARVCHSIRRIHQAILARVIAEQKAQSYEVLSRVAGECPSDVIFHIDRSVEEVLLRGLSEELASDLSFVLICEGIGESGDLMTFPTGTPVDQCAARVIIDPIDGTRGIMYDKRSAWILTGVAPNRGAGTSLHDIHIAIQTEIPTTRAALADTFWAIRGHGVYGQTRHLITGETWPAVPRPSQANSVEGGFAMLAHFFPFGKKLLATIEEELMNDLLGEEGVRRAMVFDDQYISTGGQLYELLIGHDRFNADLRGLLNERFRREGLPTVLTCHPYDICTALILEEAGIPVCHPNGQTLSNPLSTTGEVSWVGYSNTRLRAIIEPALQHRLQRHSLLYCERA
ncbi:MAG: inositol monophosphatase [Acidobacteria bacterium]|nr:inositol monophosphatase [Acidobacteriota bacterium]MBI3658495.1 inositol monophosphatase [Acidobacteriota bacterium]